MKLAVLLLSCTGSPRLTDFDQPWVHRLVGHMAGYYLDQSGGRENTEFRVFDWFQLPQTSQQWNDLGFGAGPVVKPLVERGLQVDLSPFDHFALVIDKFDAASAAVSPEHPNYVHVGAQSLDPALLEHECGHFFGAGHANLDTPTGPAEYDDAFCVMGREGAKFSFVHSPLNRPRPDGSIDISLSDTGPGMAAPTLRACGWLDLEHHAVDLSTQLNQGERRAMVELAPLRGAPVAGSPGHPVCAFADGIVPGQRILIEYRSIDGWDAGMPPQGPGWVVAHLTGPENRSQTSLQIGAIAAVPGASLFTSKGAIKIGIGAASSAGATLTVEVNVPVLPVLHAKKSSGFAVSHSPDVVEVFWVRPDGMVFTNARDPHINSGNWNNPIPIAENPGSADPRSGVAAVSHSPGVVEVFWVRPDGMVFTNARDPHINNGNWNNPIPIAGNPGSADPRSGVAAISHSPGVVEVFWVRPDGMVFTNARDPHINNGNWNNPIPIAGNPGSADPRSGVAAVSHSPGVVEVFWVRPDGMVFINARDPHINNGNWNNPIPIAENPGSADPRSGVAAISHSPGVVEVFWVRPDGMVFTNARDPHINNGNWNNPIPIAGNPGSADPRSGVAAISHSPGVVEVFWVRPDGMVFTNARDPHINNGNWNNPIPIAGNPGSADPRSGVAAISHSPGVVEVFWVRPDGMVFTNARDPHINNGNWNNPIPIAENPGSAAIRDV